MSSKTKSTMSPSSSPGPVVVMDPMRASSSSTENHPNNHNTKNNNNNNNNARLVSMSPGSYSGSHHASPTSPGNANHHDKNHKNSNNTNNNDKKDTHHNRSSSYDSLSNWSLPGVVIEDDLQYPPNENNSSLISHHTHGDNHSHGHNHDTSKNPVFPFPTMTFDHRYVNVNADADINVNGNGNGHVNHFQQSPKMIRRNPRDAASPRRSRMVVKRQEYNASTSAISPRTTGHWTTMTQHHHPETVVSRGEVITNGTNAAVAIAVGEEAVGSPTDAGNISLASLKTEDTRSMGASSSFVAFGQHANGSGGLLLPFMDNASLSSSSRSRSRTHPTTTTTMTMTTKKNNKSSSGGGGGGIEDKDTPNVNMVEISRIEASSSCNDELEDAIISHVVEKHFEYIANHHLPHEEGNDEDNVVPRTALMAGAEAAARHNAYLREKKQRLQNELYWKRVRDVSLNIAGHALGMYLTYATSSALQRRFR
mmetsp:Transcript_9278/g.17479  ORF Transcript_9278/g.17479 Transcript_9278/m.17479 type:complete len:480 (-) Transcript_9278:74-1513(-)